MNVMNTESEMDAMTRRVVGSENASEQLNLILGLRDVRLNRGMSVSEVAANMGVDPSQVSRFETGGTNPTMVTIRRYAKAVRAVFRVQVRSFEQDHRVRTSVWRNRDSDIDAPSQVANEVRLVGLAR